MVIHLLTGELERVARVSEADKRTRAAQPLAAGRRKKKRQTATNKIKQSTRKIIKKQRSKIKARKKILIICFRNKCDNVSASVSRIQKKK
jgi:hypothetical protein